MDCRLRRGSNGSSKSAGRSCELHIQGPEHGLFESELAAFLGVSHVVGVASGSDALVLALLAVDCGPGDEVVTAANAGGYASSAIARLGCDVSYAEVDSDSLLMTPYSVLDAIGPATPAVVVTHLYGNVAKVEEIVAVCRPQGIAVIEDCAQSLGALSQGRRVGTIGDVAAFSFYPTKNLGAAGDGGAVATADDDVAATVRSLRQYGWGPKYQVDRPDGINSRLDEVQAAILRVGLPGLDSANERRREIVGRYAEALTGRSVRLVSGVTPEFVAHLAVVRADDRFGLQASLAAVGVETDIHYPIPDHLQKGLPSTGTSAAVGRNGAGGRSGADGALLPIDDGSTSLIACALAYDEGRNDD